MMGLTLGLISVYIIVIVAMGYMIFEFFEMVKGLK